MQSRSTRLAAATSVLAAMLPLASHADLVRRTLDEGGVAMNVTADTATALDWLDMKLTVNQTFDEVRTGIYYQLGFRHATQAEPDTLFANAGTPDDNFDITCTYSTQTVALLDLLSDTRSASSSDRHSYGFAGTDYFGNDITLATHPVGVTFSALLGKVDEMDLRPYGTT